MGKGAPTLILAILASALLALGGLLYLSSPSEERGAPEPSPTSEPTVPQTTPPRQLEKPLQPVAAIPLDTKPAPPGELPYAKKPDGNVIEFRVVDGLAIAYGDILLGKPEAGFQGDRGAYDAPTPQLWERAEIPFLIHPELPHPERVHAALEYFRLHTPIRFIPYDQHPDVLVFEPGTEHCFSSLGRTGGPQPIKLSPECQSQEILHEIMHALGFVHEQSRTDRDSHLEILWPNIERKYHSQFAIVPESFLEALRDSPFDYRSIMLYRPDTFAIRPDAPTMRSKGATPVAPVAKGLSETDIQRLNRLYNPYE